MPKQGGSQQLYSYLGRAALWRDIRDKLEASGATVAPADARALKGLCAGISWMERVPPALLASYRTLYVILRGDAADAEEEINRDILRTVRAETGLLLDFSGDQGGEFASSINRVLNALAHVDGMGYCQGQNYVVDVMMKAGLPERDTFCLFLFLLRQGHLHGIYRKEVPMLAGYMDKFEEQIRRKLPKLAAHFEAEQYPPPLYALEWITTVFGLAARPLISLAALDLYLAGSRNSILRLCVALLGHMEDDLLQLDQEGLLKELRARAVAVPEEEAIVRALSSNRGDVEGLDRARPGSDRLLGWSTGPDYLLVLRSRHCRKVGLMQLREEAGNELLIDHSNLQDALLGVTRSLEWGRLRTCWLESCLAAGSDHERYGLANQALRFVIVNAGHAKAAAFMLGLAGADANCLDRDLVSPLHLTALFNRPDIARLLLMCGAAPQLVGGVTKSAAAKGGQLWSPLAMAEEACREGGELDEAGVKVGPATRQVLRGLACLQCNLKLPRSSPCSKCKLSYCATCRDTHFCTGRLDIGRGLPDGSGRPAGLTAARPSGHAAARGEDEDRRQWELGSAVSDGWESLFEQGRLQGHEDQSGASGRWRPGGLRRAESSASKASRSEDGDLEEIPWTTMPSVILGTWKRKPLTASPKDRDKMIDNAAAFVRACFPMQTWLQYHMEEDMGLSHGNARVGLGWGGPVRGLGMRGEYFDPEILKAAGASELHRRMSWIMAESGVSWEKDEHAWCCPECFVLFGLNVFRHHCRGCGNIYCSAHAPPTAIPSTGRNLKLCWSCVLEGAVPISKTLEDASEQTPISPTTARGLASRLAPSSSMDTDEVPDGPIASSGSLDKEPTVNGGFLSTIVSLIETVAAPISPSRPRRPGQQNATMTARNNVVLATPAGSSAASSTKTPPRSVSRSALPPRSPKPRGEPVGGLTNGQKGREATGNNVETVPKNAEPMKEYRGPQLEFGKVRSYRLEHEIPQRGFESERHLRAWGSEIPQRGFATTGDRDDIPDGSKTVPRLQRDFGPSRSIGTGREQGSQLQRGFGDVGNGGHARRRSVNDAVLKREFGPR